MNYVPRPWLVPLKASSEAQKYRTHRHGNHTLLTSVPQDLAGKRDRLITSMDRPLRKLQCNHCPVSDGLKSCQQIKKVLPRQLSSTFI